MPGAAASGAADPMFKQFRGSADTSLVSRCFRCSELLVWAQRWRAAAAAVVPRNVRHSELNSTGRQVAGRITGVGPSLRGGRRVSRQFVALAASVVILVMPGPGLAHGAVARNCHSAAGSTACLGLSGAPFVSPGQAKQIIDALWQGRENARVDQDTKLLRHLDTGSAALTDVAIITSVRCGCGPFYYTPGKRRLDHTVIYLPRQSHYPLFFAGDLSEEAAGSSSPAHDLVIVTRSSPTQPWRIAFQVYDTAYDADAAYPPPTLDTSGYDMPPASPPITAIHERFTSYVTYLNQLKRTGKQPASTPFAPGALTSGNHLQAHPNGFTSDGVTHRYTFKPGPFGGPWVFTSGGIAMVCGDVAEYSVATPAQTGHVLEYPAPTRGRVDWDWELPPGSYRSATSLYEWPVCILPETDGRLAVEGPSTGGYPARETGIMATSS
jgi:hypothetical protein